MSTHIDHEVNSCMAEMEQLQEKMRVLNETKQKQEAMNEKKIRDTEPNMEVLKSWLTKNEKAVIFDKKAKEAKEEYDNFVHRRDISTFSTEKEYHEYDKKRHEISRSLDKYYENGTDSKRMHIIQDTFQGPIAYICTPGSNKRQTAQTPSEFMKDFIESSHNLFQIQKKRIDELENCNLVSASRIDELDERLQSYISSVNAGESPTRSVVMHNERQFYVMIRVMPRHAYEGYGSQPHSFKGNGSKTHGMYETSQLDPHGILEKYPPEKNLSWCPQPYQEHEGTCYICKSKLAFDELILRARSCIGSSRISSADKAEKFVFHFECLYPGCCGATNSDGKLVSQSETRYLNNEKTKK
jgi:hypothetical protein